MILYIVVEISEVENHIVKVSAEDVPMNFIIYAINFTESDDVAENFYGSVNAVGINCC
jgi:hypothetical protein